MWTGKPSGLKALWEKQITRLLTFSQLFARKAQAEYGSDYRKPH